MEKDFNMKLRFKASPAKSGDQYHFNIPAYLIRNKKIESNKEYWIDFIEKTKDIKKDDTPIRQVLPYKASPAKGGGQQYRFTIPTFLIKNNYFDPTKDVEYWVYYSEV